MKRKLRQKLKYQEWVDLLEKISLFCEEKSIDLLIIDTLSSFWSVNDENDASLVQAALLPLNYLLEKNIAVFPVHHFRKSGGNEGTASRGSGAISSYADILVEFHRMDPTDPGNTQRKIKSLSRFQNTPEEIVIDLVNGEYISLGTSKNVVKEKKNQTFLSMMSKFPEGVTSRDMFDNWDDDAFGRRPSERTVRQRLYELNKEGIIMSIGEKIIGKAKTNIYVVRENNDGGSTLSL